MYETATAPLDQETRADASDHEALRLWLRMLTCSSMVENVIRSRLREEFNCTLPRFDLLAQLERHPQGLKMGELSKRLMVTGGNVTGITDQLVKEGWVQREEVENDRRAYRVKLTPTGRRMFNKMAGVHERWVIELMSGLTNAERRQLQELMGKLKTHMRNLQD